MYGRTTQQETSLRPSKAVGIENGGQQKANSQQTFGSEVTTADGRGGSTSPATQDAANAVNLSSVSNSTGCISLLQIPLRPGENVERIIDHWEYRAYERNVALRPLSWERGRSPDHNQPHRRTALCTAAAICNCRITTVSKTISYEPNRPHISKRKGADYLHESQARHS